MTAICAAFDNIRLIRRKVHIAQVEIEDLYPGPARDLAMLRLSRLTNDLFRALHDFAELGFEEEVAGLLDDTAAQHSQETRQRSSTA